MKKTFITCLTLLAISLCLFVSCSAENTAVNEINDVAYVTFGRDSRDFSASYIVQSYNDLFWFYTAEKADNYGTTGATIDLKAVPTKEDGKGIGSGTVGPFSQGKWTFTLSAYASLNEDNTPKTDTLVYQSGEITVTLNGGETKAIPVTVSPVGENGTIKFKNAYFSYDKEGSAAPKFLIRAVGEKATYELSNDEDYISAHKGTIRITLTKNGNEYKIAFVEEGGKLSDSIVEAFVGYYTCEAYAYSGSISDSMAFCTFGMKVYGNATTVVSGPLTENPNSRVSFDVAASDIKAFPGSELSNDIDVSVAPVNEGKTTVNFRDANLETNATYALNVEALTANAANDAFQISTSINEKEKEVLGSVKLSLTQIKGSDATSIKEFNGNVTVSTYIDKGLTGSISVVYNGEGTAPEVISYDSSTGILKFKTNHFSEFFIVRDGNVYNENQNKYYYSLEDAIEKANPNERIVLQKHLKIEKTISIDKDINIDLGGNDKGIGSNIRVFLIKDGTTTIDNGLISTEFKEDLNSKEKDGYGVDKTYSDSSVIRVSSNDSTNDDPKLIIGKNATIKAINSYGVGAFGKSSNATVDVHGTIEAYMSALSGNGSNDYKGQNVEFNIYDGSSLKSEAYPAIYQPNAGITNVYGGIIAGKSAIEVRSGMLNVAGGNLKADATEYSVKAYGNGPTTKGAAIAVAQHTTRLPIDVNISGGEFSGLVAFSEQNPQDGNTRDITVSITGGKFNTSDTLESKQVVVSTDLKNFISGGSFNDKPADDYIADGYCYSNGKIAKVQGIAKINGEDVKIANISDVAAKSFEKVKDITIDLDKDSSLTLDSGNFNESNNDGKSKVITLVGELDENNDPLSVIDVVAETKEAEGGRLNYQRGSSFTFENLTIQAGTGNFDGIVSSNLTYKNCVIKGKLSFYENATVQFIDCTFENDMADQYSIWTWGGTDVKFENCTFNTNGKAILLYGQATAENPTNLTVNNCTFNDRNNGTAGKAAIEIGNDYNATYTLTVNNATVNGFANGKNTGSKLWANKNSMDATHLSVTIDGTKVQ